MFCGYFYGHMSNASNKKFNFYPIFTETRQIIHSFLQQQMENLLICNIFFDACIRVFDFSSSFKKLTNVLKGKSPVATELTKKTGEKLAKRM